MKRGGTRHLSHWSAREAEWDETNQAPSKVPIKCSKVQYEHRTIGCGLILSSSNLSITSLVKANIIWSFLKSYSLVTQSCPALCNPMHCSPPGSSVHGISQERYCSGLLPFPPSGYLPDSGIKPMSPIWQTDYLPLSHQRSHNSY